MKSLVKFFILVCCICFLDACNDQQQEGAKPDPILDCTVTPIHGGAVINYTIPPSRDILYVLVEYKRNGVTLTDIASIHDNYLTIEGFDTTDEVNVSLYTVNHDEIRSAPKNLVFNPLESPLSLTCKTVSLYVTFGGLAVEWENLTSAELGVRLSVEEDGEWVENAMYFSTESEKYVFRGFLNVPTKFAVTFEDKWGNVSETYYFDGTPFFETEVETPWGDLRQMIPYDNVTEEGTASFERLWDGRTEWLYGQTYYRTASASQGSSFTFDLNNVVKLSRMIIWPVALSPTYGASAVYGFFHVNEFEMWGCKKLDPDRLRPAPEDYWLHPFSAAQAGKTLPWTHPFSDLAPEQIQAIPGDNFAKDWVYLGHYKVTRMVTAADMLQQEALGHHFDIPITCESVRFIRFFPVQTASVPPPNNYWSIGEMKFFGDNTVPQD